MKSDAINLQKQKILHAMKAMPMNAKACVVGAAWISTGRLSSIPILTCCLEGFVQCMLSSPPTTMRQCRKRGPARDSGDATG